MDMTIPYQFLEGAKLGSPCGGHIGQIQDGRHPDLGNAITSEQKVIEPQVTPRFGGFGGWGIHFWWYFVDSMLFSCEKLTVKVSFRPKYGNFEEETYSPWARVGHLAPPPHDPW